MLTREEKKALTRRFWTQFDEFSNNIPELAERKKKWILHDTKISHLDLKFDLSGNSAIVALEINHRSEARRIQIYELIERYRTLLGNGLDVNLVWDFCYRNENDQEVCRIYIEKHGFKMQNIQNWPSIFEFFARHMLILQDNFLEIQEYLQEDITALLREL